MKKWLPISMVMFVFMPVSNGEAQNVLDPVVVTATRMDDQESDVSSNVDVITADDIKRWGSNSLTEVLNQVTGIHVMDNNTLKSSRVDIRGFGDTSSRNILVLINGRRVNSIDLSGPDWVQIPVTAIQQIEVIRGAGSVLYGDQAVGGVINVITKSAADRNGGRLSVTYDTENSRSYAVEVSGRKGDFSVWALAKDTENKGYRDNSDLTAQDFQMRLTYEGSEVFESDLILGWHEDKQELPAGLTGAQIESFGRRFTITPDDVLYTKDRFIQWRNRLNMEAFDDVPTYLELDVHGRNRNVYDEFNSFGPFHTKRNIDRYGFSFKHVIDARENPLGLRWVSGVDFDQTENDILGSGTNVDEITIDKQEYGFYSNLIKDLGDHWEVQAGTRYQIADYDFDQKNVVVREKAEDEDWVNLLGVRWLPTEKDIFHTNVQQTFRFLVTDEWYSTVNFPGFGLTPGLNTDLEAQSGIQYESGWQRDWGQGWQTRVTGYWINNRDEIYFNPVTFANSNYDRTQRIGLETELRFDLSSLLQDRLGQSLTGFVNYTLQQARFDGGPTSGQNVPLTPRHQWGFGINWEIVESLFWTTNVRFVGEQFSINDVSNTKDMIKSYKVVDMKWSWAYNDWDVYVLIENILDEEYSTYVASSAFSPNQVFYPAPERTVVLGAALNF